MKKSKTCCVIERLFKDTVSCLSELYKHFFIYCVCFVVSSLATVALFSIPSSLGLIIAHVFGFDDSITLENCFIYGGLVSYTIIVIILVFVIISNIVDYFKKILKDC